MLYFSHVLSALLAFAAFAVVWRERERGSRLGALALAGLLAGLAIVCEYPLAISALGIGLYVVARRGAGLVRRGLAYGAGVAAGVAPLIAYQWWAFGSPLHTTCENAVARTGRSGHDVLGLNDDGFFGITAPRLEEGLSLLVGGRGLLTLTPVLLLAIAGIVAMHRAGHRAEARTILGLSLAYLVYDAGYWLPFGGGSPGPRFLIPILPLLAIGCGLAWRRWPAQTLALAVVSATTMVTATMSYPMIGVNDAGAWVRGLEAGSYQHTVLDLAGVAHGPVSVLPFVVLVALALGLGVAGLGRHLAVGTNRVPAVAGAWAICAVVLPRPGRLPSEEALVLVAASALLALLCAGAVRLLVGERVSAQHEEHHTGSHLALETQAAQRSG